MTMKFYCTFRGPLLLRALSAERIKSPFIDFTVQAEKIILFQQNVN